MKAGKFFPVPYMGHTDPVIQGLMHLEGGVAAYGRWHILLGLMYDMDGVIKLTDTNLAVLQANMDLDGEGLESFLSTCAELGLIDQNFLNKREVISEGVIDQLEFKARKAAAGRMGGRPKRNQSDKPE